MPSPRWRKILRDLWSHKTRTALVVLSIAVGVFAVGMVSSSQVMLSRGLTASYLAIHPASAALGTDDFDDEQVQVVRKMAQVQDAEGRRRLSVRLKTGPDEWQNLELIAIPDFNNIRINQIQPFGGAWPPPKRELLIERASLGLTKAQVGDRVTVETSDGKQHDLRLAGLAYDLNEPPTAFTGLAFGYITLDTLEWLGQPRTFNELDIVVRGDTLDKDHIRAVAQGVQDKVEQGGLRVYSIYIPTPGKHPADSPIQALLLLLTVLGIVSLLASGFLIVNTISATLGQQVRQIGVMKAVGARRLQVTVMYLGMVLLFGLLACVIAIPLAVVGAGALTNYLTNLVNTDMQTFTLPSEVFVLEISVGLIVPLLAALVPILRGTRVTVREAIGDYGLTTERLRQGILDRIIERVPGASRPFLLSVRNTFRRKSRLALTLTTLTLGGAIFIAVLTVRESFQLTLDDVFKFWGYDVEVDLSRPYRTELIQQQVQSVPGVVAAETWGFGNVRRVRPDGTESDGLRVNAPPAATQVIHPHVLQGRWLLPGDENAVVVNVDLLKTEPDLRVGTDLDLKFGTEETHWQVVGIIDTSLSGARLFANYPYFSRVNHTAGRSGGVLTVTDRHDPAAQTQIGQALEAHLKQVGLQVSSMDTTDDDRRRSDFQVNILVVFLMIMAVLLALVGGLGLMGTMSLNVIERTREIGVLRAIGASDGSVLFILLGEGVLIGALSWLLGVLVSIPLSRIMSDQVGVAFVNNPLDYTFSISGAWLWLILVVTLAALASFLPARHASRLTVREVLAYE